MKERLLFYFPSLLFYMTSVWLSSCAYLQLGSALAGGPELPVLTAPPVYAAPETKGVAIDAETGQPLEGVIVVAYWELKGFHTYPVGLMMVQEGVTGAQGRFELPAWGPKPRSPLTGQLESLEPELLAFKRGYVRQYEPTEIPKKQHPQQVLKFKKVPEDSKEYLRGVSFIDDNLRLMFRYEDCSWKQIPRMLVAMHQERLRLDAKGVKDPFNYIHTIEDRDQNSATRVKCGSVQEYLQSYLP